MAKKPPCVPRAPLAACLALAALGAVAPLYATDVAFWSEYAPDRDDAAKTYLLLDGNALPWKAAAGPVSAVEPIGQPARAEDGRFGAALRLDGQSGLRCTMTNVFAGGQVSLEAWVRLARYPAKEACTVFRRAVVDDDARYDPAKDRSIRRVRRPPGTGRRGPCSKGLPGAGEVLLAELLLQGPRGPPLVEAFG